MKKIVKEETFKPTLSKPVSDQSKRVDADFKKNVGKYHLKLNEVDGLLSEVEQSLKKKIFSLAKMEALVFSDPKLTAVYNEMAENGEEKYGYHYNETIQNMIFNDYVLNSPKYLQKYKMAVPKKKKRRDKSGINQLKKSGEETMKKATSTPTPAPKPIAQAPVKNETTGAAGGGAGAFVSALGHQKRELEEETSTTSAGNYQYGTKYAWGKGDLIKGKSGDAMRKPIWKGGTILAKESNYITDPSGFEKYVDVLNEQEYLDLSYQQELEKQYKQTHTGSNHGLGVRELPTTPERDDLKSDIDKNTELYVGQDVDRMPTNDVKILHNDMTQPNSMFPHPKNPNLPSDGISGIKEQSDADYIKKHSDAYSLGGMNKKDIGIIKNDIKSGALDKPNFAPVKEGNVDESKKINEKAKSPAQQRLFGMAHAVQKGELSPSKVGGAVKKIAKTVDPQDVEDFASTKHSEMEESQEMGEFIVTVKHDKGQTRIKTTASSEDAAKKKIMAAENCPESAIIKVDKTKSLGENMAALAAPAAMGFGQAVGNKVADKVLGETNLSIIDDKSDTMANKGAVGTVSAGNVPMGMTDMKENYNLLEELNNELEAFSIHHNKLLKMAEDRKPSALVLRDRVGSENETNFKKDLQHSGTKEIIDVEKELMWKDQQTDVPKDPQKLGQDIEKKELSVTKGEALKNVGDSANDEGDEIPKRNLSKEEQDEVDLYRLGQQSLVYDNEPGKRFEDRMKADMGEKMSDIRKKQMEFRGKAPMYNKDPQPVADTTAKKVQFDKEQTGWNEREGLKESMITGRFLDALNKRRLIDFTLNEVKLVDKVAEGVFPLDFTGLGNSYHGKTQDYKVSVNETVVNAIAEHKFYTDGKMVFAVKNPVQKLNETEQKPEKPVVNEQVNKMKHLLGYKPNDYVNTKNIKL